MNKTSELTSEILGTSLVGKSPDLYTNFSSGVIGALERPVSKKEQLQSSINSSSNVMPGVGSYKLAQRLNRVGLDTSNFNKKHRRNDYSKLNTIDNIFNLSSIGNIIGLSALGGYIGSKTKLGALKGALGGAGISIGSIVPVFLAAVLKKRRTLKEQSDVNADPLRVLKRLAIPGLGFWDKFKSLGYSRNYDDKANLKLK